MLILVICMLGFAGLLGGYFAFSMYSSMKNESTIPEEVKLRLIGNVPTDFVRYLTPISGRHQWLAQIEFTTESAGLTSLPDAKVSVDIKTGSDKVDELEALQSAPKNYKLRQSAKPTKGGNVQMIAGQEVVSVEVENYEFSPNLRAWLGRAAGRVVFFGRTIQPPDENKRVGIWMFRTSPSSDLNAKYLISTAGNTTLDVSDFAAIQRWFESNYR